MEFFLSKLVEKKFDVMKWNWYGKFSTNYQSKIECNWNGNGNGMETFEQKYPMRSGMERAWNCNEKLKHTEEVK